MFDHCGLQRGFALLEHVPKGCFETFVVSLIVSFDKPSKRVVPIGDAQVVLREDLFGEVQLAGVALNLGTAEVACVSAGGAESVI
jgi:hypothetical protein